MTVVVLLTALAGAPAAAPPNDVCSGAQVIPGNGPFPYATLPVDITDATISASDPPPSNPFLSTRVAQSVWFRFTPVGNAVYTLTTCADAGTLTTVSDTVLEIYTSAGGCNGPFTQVGDLGDEDCGPGGSQAAVTSPLSADTTYFIVVWKYCDHCTDDGLNTLQLIIDGSVAPPNDTCSGAIPVAVNSPMIGTTIAANNNYELDGTNGFWGLDQTLSAARGRDAIYSFTALEANTYSIKVLAYDVNQDVVLYLLTNCPAPSPTPVVITNALAVANRSRVNSAEEVFCVPLEAGQQVYVVVDDSNLNNPGSTFTLEVTRCQGEQEPNDTPEQASRLFCGIESTLFPRTDLDFFILGQYPPGWRVFAMVDGEAARNPDMEMRVTTTNQTLEFDDGDNDTMFGESSPNIAGCPLPGEATFLEVNYVGGLRESEPYRLYAVVQPPATDAAVESEPNDDPTTANIDDRNYFAGTLSGPSPSTDVDVYAFSVAEGDLIFLSLDGDPDRNNTPINARLELLDAAGNTVILVDDHNSGSNTNGNPGFFPSSPGEALVYRSAVEGIFYARVSISPTAAGNAAAGGYLLSISKNCLAGAFGVDHPPAVTNLSVTPPVTVEVPMTLSGTVWEPDTGDALSVTIAWGDGTTNVWDYPTPGRIDFAVPHTYTTAGTNIAIKVTAQDRSGARDTATRNIQVRPHALASRFRSITKLADGRFQLDLEGTPYGLYRIEKRELGGTWGELDVQGADSSGRLSIQDTKPGPLSGFYRAVGVE